MFMVVQMILKSELGEFSSEKMEVSYEQYLDMIELSKGYYRDENGLEMWLENGFMVATPNLIQRSILIINIVEYDEEENEEEK